jgi:hypothetical protein
MHAHRTISATSTIADLGATRPRVRGAQVAKAASSCRREAQQRGRSSLRSRSPNERERGVVAAHPPAETAQQADRRCRTWRSVSAVGHHYRPPDAAATCASTTRGGWPASLGAGRANAPRDACRSAAIPLLALGLLAATNDHDEVIDRDVRRAGDRARLHCLKHPRRGEERRAGAAPSAWREHCGLECSFRLNGAATAPVRAPVSRRRCQASTETQLSSITRNRTLTRPTGS